MSHIYPRCPSCGELKTSRVLYPGEAPYPAAIHHRHDGCDVQKYILRVHPDGSTEEIATLPADVRFEDAPRRLVASV